MPYIICNNDNYLAQDTKNGFSIVHSEEEAFKWHAQAAVCVKDSFIY